MPHQNLRPFLAALAFALTAQTGSAAANCAVWDMSGRWQLEQSSGHTVSFDLKQDPQNNHALSARAVMWYGLLEQTDVGLVTGNVQQPTGIQFTINWQNEGAVGVYSAQFGPNGELIGGQTRDANNPANQATFSADRNAICTLEPVPAPSDAMRNNAQESFSVTPSPTGAMRDRATASDPATPPPGVQVATATGDVDIYEGAGGQFRVVGIMRTAEKALVLGFNADGWYQLKFDRIAGGSGWVAADHLNVAAQ